MTDTQRADEPDEFFSYAEDDARPEQRLGRDKGQIGLVALVILAGLASIIMLVSGSDAALKLALLASLWAAVLGFFLVTRYRREAAERELELEMREEVFTAELERVKSQQAPAADESQAAVFADIKRELEAIRTQLDELAGREYTYEPAALQAEARRIAELESTAYSGYTGYTDYSASASQAAPDAEPEVSFTQASSGAPSADAIAGRLGSQPSAPRQDNPLADLIKEREAPAPEPVQETVPEQPAEPEAASASESPAFATGSFQAVRWDEGGLEEPAREKETGSHEKPEEAPAEPAHGRRRSDAGRSGAVTVAELMAELRKDT